MKTFFPEHQLKETKSEFEREKKEFCKHWTLKSMKLKKIWRPQRGMAHCCLKNCKHWIENMKIGASHEKRKTN